MNIKTKVEISQGMKYLVHFIMKYFLKRKSFGKLRGMVSGKLCYFALCAGIFRGFHKGNNAQFRIKHWKYFFLHLEQHSCMYTARYITL